jgi:hypothetical protein
MTRGDWIWTCLYLGGTGYWFGTKAMLFVVGVNLLKVLVDKALSRIEEQALAVERIKRHTNDAHH